MQTRVEVIKIGEENTVQLRDWEYDDKEEWSNTKSMKTQHDTHKIVQTRIEFIKIWEENTVQLLNWEYDDSIGNTMTRGRHGQIQKA